MSTITSQTNDNLNFSITRVEEGELDIPVGQEMLVTRCIKVYEAAIINIPAGALISVLGDK